MTFRLPFVPEQDGYAAEHSTDFVAIKLAGGQSRVRADVLNGTSVVNISFLLDRVDYQEFMNFFITQIERGALPFLVDLLVDFGYPSTYKAQMLPGTFKLNQVRGFSFRISMQVEVEQVEFFTGNFFFTSPNLIKTATPISFASFLQTSGSVQLLGAQLNDGVHPPINLDGTYVITSFPAGNQIALSTPSGVNADWLKLASYPSSTTGTFGPVTVLAPPT